jgi:hypothetical protein
MSETGTEISFTGELYAWAQVGILQAETYKADLPRLILNSFLGEPIALYIINENHQQFGNLWSEERIPFLYAGETGDVDPSDPAEDVNNPGRVIQGADYFRTDEFILFYDPGNENSIVIFSVFLKLRFYGLPAEFTVETVMRMRSNKILELSVNSAGQLMLRSNGNVLHTYSVHNIVDDGRWYYIVVTVGKVNLVPSNFRSYGMIEVRTDNNEYTAQGSQFICKNFSNFKGPIFKQIQQGSKMCGL